MSRPIAPIVQLRMCAAVDCDERFSHPHGGAWPNAFCSADCARRTARARRPAPRPRAELVTRAPKQRSRAVSPASPEQRAKRSSQASIVSGATKGLDPAHLCSRARGGCDDALCIVSLTRAEHRAFDAGELDLLPHLVKAGCVEEIAHAVHHYRGNLPALLARLTGQRWTPV